MVQRGDLLATFAVNTIDGAAFDYDTVWQRRNLLLVSLPRDGLRGAANTYARDLSQRREQIMAHEAVCVITFDAVARVPCPAVVVADRWSEVYFVSAPATVEELPTPDEIIEWLRFVDHECPECQGGR